MNIIDVYPCGYPRSDFSGATMMKIGRPKAEELSNDDQPS